MSDLVARLHVDPAQVAVHRHHARPVVDEHGVAVEEEIPRVEHAAGCRTADRRAGRGGDVHAAVRIARLVVEEPSQAEAARAATCDRRLQRELRLSLGRDRCRARRRCVAVPRRCARGLPCDGSTWRLFGHGQSLLRVLLRRDAELEQRGRVVSPDGCQLAACSPGVVSSGMPTSATQPPGPRSTGARWSLKITSPGGDSSSPRSRIAMPPGTRLSRGSAAGRWRRGGPGRQQGQRHGEGGPEPACQTPGACPQAAQSGSPAVSISGRTSTTCARRSRRVQVAPRRGLRVAGPRRPAAPCRAASVTMA